MMNSHRYISTDTGVMCYLCGQRWDDGTEEYAVYPCGTNQGRHHWVHQPDFKETAECVKCGTHADARIAPVSIPECRS